MLRKLLTIGVLLVLVIQPVSAAFVGADLPLQAPHDHHASDIHHHHMIADEDCHTHLDDCGTCSTLCAQCVGYATTEKQLLYLANWTTPNRPIVNTRFSSCHPSSLFKPPRG